MSHPPGILIGGQDLSLSRDKDGREWALGQRLTVIQELHALIFSPVIGFFPSEHVLLEITLLHYQHHHCRHQDRLYELG